MHMYVAIFNENHFSFSFLSRCGQLGIGDEANKFYPTLCKTLRSQRIKYVACGEEFTVALTKVLLKSRQILLVIMLCSYSFSHAS